MYTAGGSLPAGFESGWVVVLSTHNREIQEELHCQKMFNNGTLDKMAYCREISRAAVSCGPSVKLVDVSEGKFAELTGDKLDFANNCEVSCLGWALEGQVLTAGGLTLAYSL